jgi:hypothetical protein
MISFALLTTWEWGMENGESVERLSSDSSFFAFSGSIERRSFQAAVSRFPHSPFPIPHSRHSIHSPFPAPTGANP